MNKRPLSRIAVKYLLLILLLLTTGCCRHNWVEQAKTYAAARDDLNVKSSGFTLSDDEYSPEEKIVLGYTTILWECSKCQELRKEEMLGKEFR